jgi:hypothetical protein
MKLHKTYKGKYKLKNPEKYVGDKDNVVYRSSWERRMMNYFDQTDSVIRWASEPFPIPYYNNIKGRIARYFPDFLIQSIDKNGHKQTTLIEVKPYSETIEPRKRKRQTKKYLREVLTYDINRSKWESAKQYCEKKNWQWLIITEKDVNFNGSLCI